MKINWLKFIYIYIICNSTIQLENTSFYSSIGFIIWNIVFLYFSKIFVSKSFYVIFTFLNFSSYIFEILFNLLNYILFQKRKLFIKSYSIWKYWFLFIYLKNLFSQFCNGVTLKIIFFWRHQIYILSSM